MVKLNKVYNEIGKYERLKVETERQSHIVAALIRAYNEQNPDAKIARNTK